MTRWGRIQIGLLVLIAMGAGCVGPRRDVVTWWEKAGVPQTYLGLRDHFTNRKGNFPKLERKPPLLRIADPLNLESKNLAIKAAAEVKMEEDLAQQKIKALKYLATVGCGCYDEDGKLKDALLQALKDCAPAVRLAAIQTIEATLQNCDDDDECERCSLRERCGCGGRGCQICESEWHKRRQADKALKKVGQEKKKRFCQRCGGIGCSECMCSCCGCNAAGCCGREVQAQLKAMANGVDANGCFREPVPEIRAAAQRLLEMCPILPEEPVVDPEDPEGLRKDGGESPEMAPQPQPQDDARRALPLGLPVVPVVTPEQAAVQPALRAMPASDLQPTGMAGSSRRDQAEINGGLSAGEEGQIMAAVEAIDARRQQVILVFENDLMIPVGETILIGCDGGETPARVLETTPGRLHAQIEGAAGSSGLRAGSVIRFGVLVD